MSEPELNMSYVNDTMDLLNFTSSNYSMKSNISRQCNFKYDDRYSSVFSLEFVINLFILPVICTAGAILSIICFIIFMQKQMR